MAAPCRCHSGQPGDRFQGAAFRWSGAGVSRRGLRLVPAHVRPQNVVDFNGRKGYARCAIEAGVPIVPAVSIGAQDTQLFLTRGAGLAKRLGLKRIRMEILPFTFGFPFGLTSTLPANLQLPSKIITEILDPIDIAARFGENPDVDEVDAYVRSVMQTALDRLGRQRRFPVLG